MKDLFTKQEKIFILFIIGGLFVGAGVELYRSWSQPTVSLNASQPLDEIETQIKAKAILIDSLINRERLNDSDLGFDSGAKHFLSEETTLPRMTQQKLLLNINTATKDELVQLPYVGEILAERIVAYRTRYGSFQNINDLNKVKGIGNKKLNLIKPYIYIISESEK